jgi:hypothetical protein
MLGVPGNMTWHYGDEVDLDCQFRLFFSPARGATPD